MEQGHTPSRMEAARIAAGLSRTEVAAALTRHPVSVSRWENGQARCSRDVLLRLATMYGTTATELVD